MERELARRRAKCREIVSLLFGNFSDCLVKMLEMEREKEKERDAF